VFKDKEFNNEGYYEAPFSRVDFTRAEFTGCDFYECDFEKADFLGAIFIDCEFHRCNFNSYITGTTFKDSEFHECNFDHSYIFRSKFEDCNLNNGSMTDALLSTIDFRNTEFKNVKWRDTYINSPPIIIDGIESPIVALDNGYMHVGCTFDTYEWHWNCPDRDVIAMEGLRSIRFWKQNKKWIFDMLEARGLYVHPKD